MSSIEGTLLGGANPISGAAVTLYETQSGATFNNTPGNTASTYGSAAKVLATTTTSTTGSFGFSAGYTCSSDEFVYMTATGGNTGSGANKQSIQMVALGSCSHFDNATDQAKVKIAIGELSTVAAGYALSNFISITDHSDGLQTVSIGAPLANNASSPGCTGTGSSMTCTAAGLAHAFANAALLVDSVHYDSTTPTGKAYTVSPVNASGSVPQAMINLIANIQQSCVNSAGGVAGDSSACGNVFSSATPPGGTAPINTLQAMINIAQYPENNANTLARLVGTKSVFLPSLTVTKSLPADLSIAISYPANTVNGTATSFVAPDSVALDAQGNVYVDDDGGATGTRLFALANNGSGLWTSAVNSTYTAPAQMATDTLGQIWVPNNKATAAVEQLLCYQASTGAACSTATHTAFSSPFATAVDRSNNVWVSSSAAGANVIQLYVFKPSTSYAATAMSGKLSAAIHAIAIDAGQNIWAATFGSSTVASQVGYLAYSSGSYASSPVLSALPVNGANITYNVGGIAVDSSQNAYVVGHAAVSYVVPNLSLLSITSLLSTASNTITGATGAQWNELDGSGVNWYGAASTGIYGTSGTAQTNRVVPCFAPAAVTTCATGSTTPAALQGARSVAIDASGSIWVAYTTSGNVGLQQIIGTGAPTWPQLSYGHPGTKPQ